MEVSETVPAKNGQVVRGAVRGQFCLCEQEDGRSYQAWQRPARGLLKVTARHPRRSSQGHSLRSGTRRWFSGPCVGNAWGVVASAQAPLGWHLDSGGLFFDVKTICRGSLES